MPGPEGRLDRNLGDLNLPDVRERAYAGRKGTAQIGDARRRRQFGGHLPHERVHPGSSVGTSWVPVKVDGG